MDFDPEDLPKFQDPSWRRKNSRTALANLPPGPLAFGLMLIFAGNVTTGTGNSPYVLGHRFEPGPIVNGHNRQPTPREIEARTQQLRAWSAAGAGSCLVAPSGSAANVMEPRGTGPFVHDDDHLGISTTPVPHPDRRGRSDEPNEAQL